MTVTLHHLIYKWFQILTIPLANGGLIYRMWKERNVDWNQYEIRETYNSYYEAFNMFDLNPGKERCPEINKFRMITDTEDSDHKKSDGDSPKLIPVSYSSGKPFF